jgi:hypothetical protein
MKHATAERSDTGENRCDHLWMMDYKSNGGQYGLFEYFYCQRNPEHRLDLHNGKIMVHTGKILDHE